MGIDGVKAEEPKVHVVKESASSVADKVEDKATEGVKAKIVEAAKAVKTALADSDGDGQEHNEL
jgi:FK506-binding protein 2